MKRIDNRQKQWTQPKSERRLTGKDHGHYLEAHSEDLQAALSKGGVVYGLLSNLLLASKLAQAAKHCHLSIHNFDKAEPLLAHARQKMPKLVILDWDDCEAEAFKLLKEMTANADLMKVPRVGFVSNSKRMVRDEAQRAGCTRVYGKAEFPQVLEDLFTRAAA